MLSETNNEPIRHILLDIWVSDADKLALAEPLRSLFLDAALAGGARILAERFEQFEPSGVTGFVLLAESHLSVHTWVEQRHAAIDLLTCGRLDVYPMLRTLRQGLAPNRERCRSFERGY